MWGGGCRGRRMSVHLATRASAQEPRITPPIPPTPPQAIPTPPPIPPRIKFPPPRRPPQAKRRTNLPEPRRHHGPRPSEEEPPFDAIRFLSSMNREELQKYITDAVTASVAAVVSAQLEPLRNQVAALHGTDDRGGHVMGGKPRPRGSGPWRLGAWR